VTDTATSDHVHPRRAGGPLPWRWPLHWQILLGLIVGAILGGISAATALSAAEAAGAADGAEALVLGRWDFLLYDLIGDLFISGLKLIIVPIVVSSIVLAIGQIGATGGFGRLGLKTLGYYLATSTIAILIGLTLVNLVGPGFNNDGSGILVGRDLSAFAAEQAQVDARAEGRQATDFLDVFRAMVPTNIIGAASDNGQLLGLIVVSLLVGYFLSRLVGDPHRVLMAGVKGVYEITLKVTDLVLMLAPIGVAALIAATVAQYAARLIPTDDFQGLAVGVVKFALTALAALGIHFGVTMPLLLVLVARVNPLRHYRAMAPALLTAFSTASSSATLPVTLECVEDRAGVSNKTASFVLPLGATVNMDGTALYECVAAVFLAQAFGIELSFAQQAFVVVVALLTSIGVAGVPSASIVAIVLILTAITEQLQATGELAAGASLVLGLGLIWVFDRPLDMCRTATNVFSDSVGAVVIARSEGETPLAGDAVE
jgi:Na+/H+-dicarboxylate symporter